MNQVNGTTAKTARKGSMWGKLLKYGLPLAMSIGLCYVLFHDMNFSEMADFVKKDCDFKWIFMSAAIGFLGFIFRAMRWQIQLRASSVDAPLHAVTYSIIGTYAVNLVFPRLGEIWRSEYISRRQKAPFATVLGSMIADRLADTATVLLLLIATFFLAEGAIEGFIEKYPAAYQAISSFASSPWIYIAAAVALVAAWWFMRHNTSNKWILNARRQLRNLLDGFLAIFKMRHKWRWLLLTLLLWGAYFSQMWLCFHAFGFTREIIAGHGITAILVCFVLSSISMGVPSNGGIGPYQLTLMFALGCFATNINEQEAGAFANVVLGTQTLLTIICGLVTFIAIGIENRSMAKRGKTIK